MVPLPPASYRVGALLVFTALPCPTATVAGRSIPFLGTGYGAILGLAGIALLVTGVLRRAVDAPIAVIVIAGITAGLALILGAVSPYGGSLGWGWGVATLGLGIAVIGARSWAAGVRTTGRIS